MKCPRCSAETTTMENKGVAVDVCFESCGGIWFDWLELKKMDMAHEADPEFLKKLSQSKTRHLDLAARVTCPKCRDIIMMRRFSSVKRNVEMDECPKCGGMWLDAGELTHIQNEFKSDEDAKKATEKFIADVFKSVQDADRHSPDENRLVLEKKDRALRFITPFRR